MGYDTLINHYQINFALLQYHKYSLDDINNMMPFERQLYITMLLDYLEKEKQKMEKR